MFNLHNAIQAIFANATATDATIAGLIITNVIVVWKMFFDSNNASKAAQQEAIRALASPEIKSISHQMYLVIALSSRMAKPRNVLQFDNFRKRADIERRKLDNFRTSCRYFLWGFDDGIRELENLPDYITHFRQRPGNAHALKVIEAATSLRLTLDKVILRTYVRGKLSGCRMRFVVWWQVQGLRKLMEKSAP